MDAVPIRVYVTAGGPLPGAGKAWGWTAGVSRAAAECSAAGAEASDQGMGMAVLTVRVQMAAATQSPGTVQIALPSFSVLPPRLSLP